MHKEYLFLGDYINGEFVRPKNIKGNIQKFSPGDLSDCVFNAEFNYSNLEDACEAAQRAYPQWRDLSLQTRAEYLDRLKTIFSENVDIMANLISRETGKPLWEAKTEAGALAGKINVTLNHSIKLVEDQKVPEALPGVDGRIHFNSRGALAVIGPFNFPAHLPNGHIIPALITGNTVVFKPSELTPAVGQFLAELIHKSGIPKGVFNLVQGNGEVGKRLVSHKKIDGVLFTGSYETGLRIQKEIIDQYWKICALEMGGKNSTIIWKDADLEKAVYETIVGSFVSAGQRCSCTSRIFLHPEIKEAFLEKFIENTKKLSIGHWEQGPFMGSLINEKSQESFLQFQGISAREDNEIVLKGEALSLEKKGYYVSPSINIVKSPSAESVFQTSEIFGPMVAIYENDDLEETLVQSDNTGYGLAKSIFTNNKENYERAMTVSKVGILNWNRSTVGASSRLPFGGLGKSGNDNPSAHFAVYYCTTPVASLMDTQSFDPSKVFPGMNYKV